MDRHLRRIVDFTGALAAAVHDAKHEQANHDIRHYWDTDLLYWSVFGVPPDRKTRKDLKRPSSTVISAMHAAGFFGPVFMLQPHFSELFQVIESAGRPRRPSEVRRSIHDFVAENSVLEKVIAIGESASKLDRSSPDRNIQSVLERLGKLPDSAFAAVESLAHGFWPERLKRLLDEGLLVESNRGPVLSDVVRDWRLEPIATSLTSLRSTRPEQTAIDAAALTALCILNERHRDGQNAPFVRFHTQSPQVRSLLRRVPWLEQALSYQYSGEPDGRGSIVRDDYYYRLRAFLPNLNPKATVSPLVETPSLESLEEVSNALLEGVPDSSRPEVLNLTLPDGGKQKTVEQLIVDFETASAEHVWLRWKPDLSEFGASVQRGIDEIQSLSRFGFTTRHLSSRIDDAHEKLLHSARAAGRLSLALGELRTEIFKHAAESQAVLKSLTFDYAVARWGISVDPEDDSVPVSLDDTMGAIRDLILVRSSDSTDVQRRAELRVAQLLGLDAFQSVVATVNGLADHGLTTDALELMRLVASLRLEESLEAATLQAFHVVRSWPSNNDLFRNQFVVGYAFVVADVAERLIPTRLTLARTLAAFSIRMVENERLRLQDPLALFALNHIVYVDALFDLQISGVREMASRLEHFVADASHAEEPYRILDTLAWHYYSSSERTVNDQERDVMLRKAFSFAERALNRAPRDPEIISHRNQLIRLFPRLTDMPSSDSSQKVKTQPPAGGY